MEIRAKISTIRPNYLDVSSEAVEYIMGTYDFDLQVVHFDGSWDELLDAAKSNKEYRLVEVDRG